MYQQLAGWRRRGESTGQDERGEERRDEEMRR